MLTYLVKFQNLPQEVKTYLNDGSLKAKLNEIEQTFGVSLAALVMKVAVKELKLDDLGAYLVNDLKLSATRALELEKALRREIFVGLLDYLLGDSRGPKHVIDNEDEKEVAKHLVQDTSSFDKKVEDSVEEVFRLSRVNFSSDPLSAGRFKQIIKSYLRGGRDRVSSFDSMIKNSELGGTALSRDTAERALIIADNYLAKLSNASSEQKKVLPKSLVGNIAQDADYNLEQVLKQEGRLIERKEQENTKEERKVNKEIEKDDKEINKQEIEERKEVQEQKQEEGKSLEQEQLNTPLPSEPLLDLSHELMPPTPALIDEKAEMREDDNEKNNDNEQINDEVKINNKEEVNDKEETLEVSQAKTAGLIKQALAGEPLNKEKLRSLTSVSVKVPRIDNLETSSTGKVKMHDIKFNPRILSPVDELRYLTLKQFRRLSIVPEQAVEKIKEKMESLGRYDYGKKIEGIAAWRESPLNNLYLEIGRRSLKEHISVDDIVKENLATDPDGLRQDELEAIIFLNQSLKF